MKATTKTLLATVTAGAAMTAGSAQAATLIDYTFGGTDVGPAIQVLDNGLASDNGADAAGSTDISTGVFTTGTNGGGSASSTPESHTLGFNSSGLVDLTAGGYTSITATFVVDSITLTTGNVTDLLANGLFFGVVGGSAATSSEWNADSPNVESFGYLPGSSKGATSDHTMARNNGSGSGRFEYDGIASTEPTNASLIDGFTVSITINDDNTWSITSTGLSTELSDSGTAVGLWADLSGGVGLVTSLQGDDGGSVDIGRMTLTAVPEPGSLALLGLGGLCMLRRRRG